MRAHYRDSNLQMAVWFSGYSFSLPPCSHVISKQASRLEQFLEHHSFCRLLRVGHTWFLYQYYLSQLLLEPPFTRPSMAPSKIFPDFPLPLELLCEIIKLLPLTDIQTLSLASRLTRSQAIHFIFGHLRYSGDIPPKVRNIHQAGNDVKAVITCVCLF